MYLEPLSPCAFSNPYAFSRLAVSDLLFICPPDALHCMLDVCPLYIIHLCFHTVIHAPPFFSILRASPQLTKKMPKAQSHPLGLSIM